MANKISDPRFHKLLLLLTICLTTVLMLFLLRHGSDGNGSGGGYGSFSIDVLRGIFKNLNSNEQPKDKFLGGLLTAGFDEGSCLSRYQAATYWKVFDHKPSPYLLEKLRAYERLHKKCGPYTELYNKSIEILISSENIAK